MTDPTPDDDLPPPGAGAPSPPCSYRAALAAAGPFRLRAILRELGSDPGRKSAGLADALADRLDEPGMVPRLIAALGPSERQALGLFALSEAPSWPAVAFGEALRGLGLDQRQALDRPLALGLIAPMPPPADPEDRVWPLDPERVLGMRLLAHPAVLEAARVAPPEGGRPPALGEPARLVRESDGLEPVLRLASLWQLADAAPLKRTRQGGLYKRDRQRLDEDPALSGPIADVLRPLDDPVALWLGLARAVGLLIDEPESDRIVAAPPSIWSEHGVHLPQMIASRWLGGADLPPGSDDPGPALALRAVALLQLATRGEGEWVGQAELAGWLAERMGAPALPEPLAGAERRRGRPPADDAPEADPMAEALRAALLGPAYLMGLVRVGEAGPGRSPAVQLSERGRYVLGLGPPPPPPPRIEQFLFVQPNFEIIAYRQGLNPALIGRLSRFARWEQLGSALTLRLNSDSIDRGLASGLSADEIRDWLARHGVRPLPDGVRGAIASWAGRRDRLTYYASATLIEFPTAAELEEALAEWPEGPPSPARVADRVLLVEDEGAIPFRRFRLAGARDYRRPPESCVEVGGDGVTLSADPARGDLFVEAELSRFADPAPAEDSEATLRRRFVVTPGSLRRASAEGLTASGLAQWYAHRTGGAMPPAVRWLTRIVDLDGAAPPEPLRAVRPLVIRSESPEVLDGLMQHPATRSLFGDRLGPTAAIVRSGDPGPLREALARLGVPLVVE